MAAHCLRLVQVFALLGLLATLVVAQAPANPANVTAQLAQTGITVVFPGDAGYANASRPFNLRFILDPAAVAYPSNSKEVAEVVRLGGAAGFRVVARSGGHSYIANGLGGKNGTIVVDLKGLSSVVVNEKTETASIGGGARLGDIVLGLNSAGRGMPHGTCAYVGIGGHATHGGFGFTSRMWGLALDNILSLEVVLANGTIVTASQDINPDLYWAMRGSGSSFGIATSFEFRTFSQPSFAMIVQYNWQLNYSLAAQGLGIFQEYVQTNIPPELGLEIVLTPGQIEGNISFGLTASFYGEASQMNATIEPFLVQMPPINSVSFSGNGTYIDNMLIFAGGVLDTSLAPDGNDAFYAKSVMTPTAQPLNDAARLAMMKYLSFEGFNSVTGWFMELGLYGGSNSAINAVPLDSTSFGRRNSQLTMQFYTQTHNNMPPFPDSGFGFLDGLVGNITTNMPANWDYGAYVNYIDDRLPDWQNLYYGSHYPRLETLKKIYDPKDVFKFPVSIQEPSA